MNIVKPQSIATQVARIAIRATSLAITTLLLAAYSTTAFAETTDARASVETPIGVEGVYYLRHTGTPIAARPVDERSPIVLRISNQTPQGAATLYELRYIGTRAGPHDLRDYLVDESGGAPRIPPILVSVTGVLPADHDGILDASPSPDRPFVLPYGLLARGALVLWLIVSVVIVAKRMWPRKAEPVLAEVAPLSLADQLRPLVEAALAGRSSPAEHARLEALLLAHWRAKFGLARMPPEKAIAGLRRDPAAARLLGELERWLHARPGAQRVDVAALLEPYRRAAPMTVIEAASAPLAAEAPG